MRPKTPRSTASRLAILLFSALFALAFGGGGLYFGLIPLVRTLHSAWVVQAWQAVPAQVLSSRLQVHSNSDGTTYRVTARYRYEFGGRTYESGRIGLDPGDMADNIGRWHRDWSGRLSAARDSGRPLTAWVDPAHPSQALLERDIRWPLLLFRLPFTLVFTGVGLVAAWMFVRALIGADSPPASIPATRSSASRTQAPAWFFAVFWCGISFPMTALFWLTGQPWWVDALLSIFSIVGLGLIALAAKQSLLAWRYAGSTPHWNPDPPRAGQTLRVTLTMPARAVGSEDAASATPRLRLAQYRVDDSGSGSSERQVEHFDAVVSVWPDPQGGARWEARFELPADAPTHHSMRSGERVEWRLELLGPDGKEQVSFDVPVQAAAGGGFTADAPVDRFDRRAEWRREVPVPPSTGPEVLQIPADTDRPQLPDSVRVVETPETYELHFSQSGWRWLAALMLGASVALSVWGWTARSSAGEAFLPGDWRWWLAALLMGLGMHAASRRRSVVVRDEGLVVQVTSWMGTRRHSLRPSAFEHLFHKLRYTQTGSNGSVQAFHAVHAREADGGFAVRLSPGLPGPAAAVAVARALLNARSDRAGRFPAGAHRSPQPSGWRPGPGWLLWALLVVLLTWGAGAA